jgi:indoleamine 2,3-dioxygenase
MDFTSFDDGFFCINEKNGFLPKKDPLEKLPDEFHELQLIIDNLPKYIQSGDILEQQIQSLPNFLEKVKCVSDIFIIQALFRAYSFLASSYLLQPSFLKMKNGIYGEARQILPSNITQPFEFVADKLGVYPYLDYHYAYSSGNYIKIKKDVPESDIFNHDNLKMACSFSGGADENGFVMIHVDIVSKTRKLIEGIKLFTNSDSEEQKLTGLNVVLKSITEINKRRQLMWKASKYENYNTFRAFIMGICGNKNIFGEGVLYEGSENTELRTYRGQTGAQDDTIPTLDIFTGVINYYPDNELTKYLFDLRKYRPVVFQKFFEELEKHTIDFTKLSDECKKTLYLILVEIYNFRNGHWQFVQKYILENTKYPTATGGTPITSWIPNQIGAVLKYMKCVLDEIDDSSFVMSQSDKLSQRTVVLNKQTAELTKPNYCPFRVFSHGEQFNELDTKNLSKCPM